MMGENRVCISRVVLVLLSVLLLVCISHGFGRQLMETGEFQEEEAGGEYLFESRREMIEVMDYKDPGPNTNPKSGYIFSPPPAPQP